MRSSTVVAILPIAACVAAASYYQYDYAKHGEDTEINERIEERRDAASWADAANRAEQSWEECRSQHSYLECNEWPKRRRAAFYKSINDDTGWYGGGPRIEYIPTNRDRRNEWLGWLAISLIFAFTIRKFARESSPSW
ncbi:MULTISPECIES: hypothetical protein [Sphingobium]|uniref:hypothetical protein n=1 Tax=Sphingobium TaxID=165695 RepID=UPI000A982C3B|nr:MULTISPECIES: hypothetical protein [Sphingobium]MDV3479858.1 hypothetical protein [Sphingobium yanoikuyae]